MNDSHFQTLVEKLRTGDIAAREDLVREYAGQIRTIVRRSLPDRLRQEFDSLDFAQDVWVSFLALPADRMVFPNPSALAGFLTRMARNKLIDTIRRRMGTQAHNIAREQPLQTVSNEAEREIPLVATDPSPSQELIARERVRSLEESLPEQYRSLVRLLESGLSHQEIADRLDVTTRTVERLVQKLKSHSDRSDT